MGGEKYAKKKNETWRNRAGSRGVFLHVFFFFMRLFQNPPICACCVAHQKYAANTCKIVVWNGSESPLLASAFLLIVAMTLDNVTIMLSTTHYSGSRILPKWQLCRSEG